MAAVASPRLSLAPRGVTVRAVVLGLILIPLNSYWVIQMELYPVVWLHS